MDAFCRSDRSEGKTHRLNAITKGDMKLGLGSSQSGDSVEQRVQRTRPYIPHCQSVNHGGMSDFSLAFQLI